MQPLFPDRSKINQLILKGTPTAHGCADELPNTGAQDMRTGWEILEIIYTSCITYQGLEDTT